MLKNAILKFKWRRSSLGEKDNSYLLQIAETVSDIQAKFGK